MSYFKDYQFGIEQEEKIKEILEKQFDTKLTKLSRYAKFDFESEKCLIEVKSRNVTSTRFDSTMLPYTKIEGIEKQNKEVYFVFNFTDKIYYIQYNQELFKTFGKANYKRKQRIDYDDKEQLYIFIPIKNLSLINV